MYEQVKLSLVGGGINRVINFTMANFGVIPYGSSMQGRLVYPSAEFDGKERNCGRMPCNYGCDPLTQAIPPFHLEGNRVNIVMLDRVPDQLRANLQNCSHLDKAINAALAGADAVIIVDTDNDPNVAVASSSAVSAVKQSLLKVPVGMISAADGAALRDALRKEPPGSLFMHLDFLSVIKETADVVVEIWHDTADDCGANCGTVWDVMTRMASMATTLQIHDKRVRFEPHYMFSSYCGANCGTQCINGRYCYLAPTNAVTGAEIAAENLRQACVFSVLQQNGRAANWWAYSLEFHNSCKSALGKFNLECSIKVFGGIWPELMNSWRGCWQGVGTADAIDVAERELALAVGTATRARVILNPTVRINDQQYRGNFDKATIFKAICSAFPDGAAPEACSQFGLGECSPGRAGAATCSNANSLALHRTRCVEKFMDFECQCAAGYVEAPGSVGCVDVDECENVHVCAMQGPRAVCVNTPGSYRCEQMRNECTAENNYGGCWKTKRRGGGVITSCVDNLQMYRLAGAGALPPQPLSRCECTAIPGCWHDQGDGTCVQLCPASRCLADKGVCTAAQPGLSTTTIILLIVLICGAATAGTLALHRYYRASVDDRVRRLLADYVPLESSSDRAFSYGGDTTLGFGGSKRDLRWHSGYIRAGEPGSQYESDGFVGP